MRKSFATALASIALLAAGAASAACIVIIIDEPEMPKSLIER